MMPSTGAGAASANPTPTPSAPRRALLLLAFAAFVSGASMRIAEPLLPKLASDFGVTVRAASLVLAAFSLAYGMFQIVHGPLGDRIGKLRAVTIAMGLASLASFGCAVMPTLDSLALLRFVAGAFSGAVIPLSLAWIGDRVPYEERQAVLGKFISGTLLGQSFGPLLGGVMSDLIGWRATFVTVGIAFVVVGLMLWPEARRSARPPAGPRASAWTQYAAILHSPRARPVLATVAIEGFLFFGAFGFVGAWLHQRFDLSLTLTGVLVACFGIGGVCYSLTVKQLVRRLGETGLVAGGGVVLCVSYVALAWVPTWQLTAPLIVALGFGFYMMHNTLQTRATEMAPQARGAGVSFFAFCLFLGQAAGVGFFGWAVEAFGFGLPIAGAGVALVVLSQVFRASLKRMKKAAT